MSYEEIIEMATDELVETALAKFRSENVEINELLDEQQAMLEKLDEVFFSDSNRNLIEQYINGIYRVTMKERNYLYLQGMKDSITLLKELKVI